MIGLMSRVFVNGPGDQVQYQRLKMGLDTALLSNQLYKARIKGKMGQSSEWSRTLLNNLV